jgi:hypothetical protein
VDHRPASARDLRPRSTCTLTSESQLIFVGPPSSDLESLSVPLHQILSTKFEQPMFGANYFTFEIAPAPSGGLTRGTRGELRVRDQALFSFVNALEKTRERAVDMRREQADTHEADGLRESSTT